MGATEDAALGRAARPDGTRLHFETSSLGRPELDEPGGGELPVEGERLADAERPHEREARRVHVRVLAFVVAAKAVKSLTLEPLVHEVNADALCPLEGIEKLHSRPVPRTPQEECPRLATDVVRRDQRRIANAVVDESRIFVVSVPRKLEREPERGVDEDQGFALGP